MHIDEPSACMHKYHVIALLCMEEGRKLRGKVRGRVRGKVAMPTSTSVSLYIYIYIYLARSLFLFFTAVVNLLLPIVPLVLVTASVV
jgi:hypothetical protein